MRQKKSQEKDLVHWTKALKNTPAFLVGNGPSLNKVNVKLLKQYFTIGINRCFLKIDPTILIWQDLALWVQEKNKVKKLKALKYCRKGSDLNSQIYHFQLLQRKAKLASTANALYGRGSSGSLAFQLAYLLGCNPIILVGMDCRYKGSQTNFYGVNPMHRSHTLQFCKKALKWIKNTPHGRKIINCSKNKIFAERLSIEEAIESIEDIKPISREKVFEILKIK